MEKKIDRRAIQLVQYMECREFGINVKTDVENAIDKYSLNLDEISKIAMSGSVMFYHPFDTASFFGVATKNRKEVFIKDEMVYRMTMYKHVKDIMGYSKKIRMYESLYKNISRAADGSLVDNEFIKTKCNRYIQFTECLVNFLLSMAHSLYYSDFKTMKYSGDPLYIIVDRVIGLVDQIEKIYDDELEEEYPTRKLLERLTGKNSEVFGKKDDE
jgi:hypothetical protein